MTIEQSSNDTTNQQERQLELAWLAGIWEGEGDFTLVFGSGKRIMPRATAINTDFVLIEAISAALTRFGIGHYIQTRKGGCDGDPRHKDAKVIVIAGYKRMATFLPLLRPLLRGRKGKVVDTIYGLVQRRLSVGPQTRYSSADLETVKTVRALNHKGPIESSETTCQPLPTLSNQFEVRL